MPYSHVTEGNSSSVLSSAPRPFCVVCGTYRDDLSLRKSGLKCPDCIGKRANKQWSRLQKRQASQLYSEVMAQQMNGSGSGRTPRPSYTFGSLPSNSSSALLSDEEGATDSDGRPRARHQGERATPQHPISAYVEGTSVYLRAVERQSGEAAPAAEGGADEMAPVGSFDTVPSPPPPAAAAAAPAAASPTATAEEPAKVKRRKEKSPTAAAAAAGKAAATASGRKKEASPAATTSTKKSTSAGATKTAGAAATPAHLPTKAKAPVPTAPSASKPKTSTALSGLPVRRSSEPAAAAALPKSSSSNSSSKVAADARQPPPPRQMPKRHVTTPGSGTPPTTPRSRMSGSWSANEHSFRGEGLPERRPAAPPAPSAQSQFGVIDVTGGSISAMRRPSEGNDTKPTSAQNSASRRGGSKQPGGDAAAPGGPTTAALRPTVAAEVIAIDELEVCDEELDDTFHNRSASFAQNGSQLNLSRSTPVSRCDGNLRSSLGSVATASSAQQGLAPSASVSPQKYKLMDTYHGEEPPQRCSSLTGSDAGSDTAGARRSSTKEGRTVAAGTAASASAAEPGSTTASSSQLQDDRGSHYFDVNRLGDDDDDDDDDSRSSNGSIDSSQCTSERDDHTQQTANSSTDVRREEGPPRSASLPSATARPTVSLERLCIAVKTVTAAELREAAQRKAQLAAGERTPPGKSTASASSSKKTTPQKALPGRHSSSNSFDLTNTNPSRGSSSQREAVTVTRTGKFTVTRRVHHERTLSSSLGSTGSGSGGSTAAPPSNRTEVKKMVFEFVLSDAETKEEVRTVRHRYFNEIIPFCEGVKRLQSGGADLPPVPSKRVPSLRFATEAFLEERRAEVQSFFDHLNLHLELLQRPTVLKFLKLEDLAVARAEGAAGAQPAAGHPPEGAAGGSGDAPAAPAHGDTQGGNPSEAPRFLSVEMLEKLRHTNSTTTIDKANFYRTDSATSGLSSRSSVQRRSRLDRVTAEDIEQVQLGSTIGRGSFGTVRQGLLQTSSGPVVVAVKVTQVGVDVDSNALGTAQEELDILKAASHKNVIRFLGSIYHAETRELRIFTEYVECGTIHSMVERFGSLPLLAIQKYMQQILNGLAHLHSLNIVHRDIKGENILVTKNGKVKLTDFGCSGVLQDINGRREAAAAAQAGEQGSGAAATSTTPTSVPTSVVPVGSPLWMSPEIIHGEAPEKAADVWALGCVGLEMLDREIWSFGNTARGSGNPYLFMFKIGQAGTPPHGLPTAEEMAELKASHSAAEYEVFELYLDFLRQCLRVRAEERWTATELQQHPFLVKKVPKYLRWVPPSGAPVDRRPSTQSK